MAKKVKNKRAFSSKERTRFSRNVKRLLNERRQMNLELVNEETIRNATISTSLQSGNQIDEITLRNRLAEWVNQHRIAKRAVNELLQILKSSGMDSLPLDYRTLLQTPVNVEITKVAGGEYWFNGLEKSLRAIFSTLDRDLSIGLNFNIDGLPIYNSSKTTFYPILASIHGEYCAVHLFFH